MRYTNETNMNRGPKPRLIAVAVFVCLVLIASSALALNGTLSKKAALTSTNVPAGAEALVNSAFADGDVDQKGDTIAIGGLTYKITQVAAGENGKVELTGVDLDLSGAVTVPATVVSENSGLSYDVSAVNFSAFDSHKFITAISLPGTVEGFSISQQSGSCLFDCPALTSVEVDSGSSALASVDGVLYAKGASGLPEALLRFPQACRATSLDVPATVHTVLPYAAYGANSLLEVSFTGSLSGAQRPQGSTVPSACFSGGIGNYAFSKCTSLTSVNFAEGMKIGTALSMKAYAIGIGAFEDCASLSSIKLPNLESATRKASAYSTFEELNPDTNQKFGMGDAFTSGFMSYWHNQDGPVARAALADSVFKDCSSLKSVVLEAGNCNGAFAYWVGTNSNFAGCDSLVSIIYEGKQAYFGNPSQSMQNGAIVDIWTDSSTGDQVLENIPSMYYAVDYYATSDEAAAADAEGSARIARVEYKAGTSVSDIATSADALADQMADRNLYAQTDADGVAPSASEAAAAAGLGEGDWVWRLTDTQSRRSGLSDSCKAYLVKRADISAGRLSADAQTALYLACDRNLSESKQADCAFDIERYQNDTNYRIDALSGETDPQYTYDNRLGAFLDGFVVCAADGTQLDATDYTVSYKTYDSESQTLVDSDISNGAGAYYVTITPTAESGYTGTLGEWIIVKVNSGSVVSGFADTPAGTAEKARYVYSQTESLSFADRPYSVTVGSCDAAGTLVASGYAGLVGGAVNVADSESESYGFKVNPSSRNDGQPTNEENSTVFSRTTDTGAMESSTYAVKCYKAFERLRNSFGASKTAYPWGNVAVLMPSLYEQYYAAAANWAYAMKAPVFFTNDDGSISDETAECLANFKSVVVMGSEAALPAADYSALETKLGSGVQLSRLQGASDTAGSFSIALADDLIARGKATATAVAVVDSAQPADAAASVLFTGHEKGLLLTALSTDDAKLIANYLHEHSDSVSTVFLAGRGGSSCASVLESTACEGSVFGSIWKSDAVFGKVMASVTSSADEYKCISITRPERGQSGGSSGGNTPSDGDNPSGGDTPSGDQTDSTTPSGDDANNAGGSTSTDGGGNSTDSDYVVENYSGASTYAIGSSGAASKRGSLQAISQKVGAFSAAGKSDGSADSDSTGGSGGTVKSTAGTFSSEDEDDGEGATNSKSGLAGTNGSSGSSEESAPLTTSVPFLATLGVLCAAAAPVLRRCK